LGGLRNSRPVGAPRDVVFEGIAEQQGATGQIRRALEADRLPHAWLFAGSAGTGRATVARRLAGVLLCARSSPSHEPCGECESCRLLRAGTHPDYVEVGLPEGKQSLPIESIREVQHSASLKPFCAPRRVFVVRDAERMTLEAANCFLKTLEEPPGQAVFILLASSLRVVPETVVSRCRLVRFANMPPEQLARRLQAAGASSEDALWLAWRAWGSPGLAERLREAGLHDFNKQFIEKLRALTRVESFATSDWLGDQASRGAASAAAARDVLQELLECAALYYRDLALLAVTTGGACVPCNRALADELRERARRASPEAFLRCADLVLEAIEAIGANAQRRLCLDDLLTRLAPLTEAAG